MMTLVNFLTAVFETITILMFISTYVDKKTKAQNRYLYIIAAVLLSVIISVSSTFVKLSYLNLIIISGSIFFVIYVYSKKLIGSFLQTMVLVVIFTITEIVTSFIIVQVAGITLKQATFDKNYRVLGIILSKLFAFAVIKIICLRSNENKPFVIKYTYWILFIVIFATTTTSVYLLFIFQYAGEGIKQYNSLATWCSFGLLYSTFFALYLYESVVKQSEKEKQLEIERAKSKAREKQVEAILDGNNELKKFRHDTINHHIAIQSYFEKHDWEGGIKYISDLSNLPMFSANDMDTGNPAVDSIIDSKRRKAMDKQIEFITEIQIPEQLFVNSMDLCTILGNALDNCIEACEKLEDDKQKIISISMIYDDEALISKISNTAEQLSNVFLQTTKDDKDNHGFGVGNIKSALAKYNSIHSFRYDNGEFVLAFVIFKN